MRKILFTPVLNRKLAVSTLFMVCVISNLSNFSMAGTSFWSVDPAWSFKHASSGGPISFDSTIRTSQIRFADNLVYFTNLILDGDTWSELGLQCSGNAEMLITELSDNRIKYTVSADTLETSVTKLLLPSKSQIIGVDGCTSWNLAANTPSQQ